MNKAFRIIWSHTRHAFVVVDELTSACGKRSASRLLLAGVGAGLLASSGAVLAASDCSGSAPRIAFGQTLSSTCWLDPGANLTVEAGGAIESNATYGVGAGLEEMSWGSISNAGNILAANGIGIAFGPGSGQSISNLATGVIRGNQAGIQLNGEGDFTLGSLSNAGMIKATFSYGTAIRLIDGVTLTGSLSNTGTVDGNFGISLFDSTIAGDLVNGTGGKIFGVDAAIQIGDGASIKGVIRNEGLISGHSAIRVAREPEAGGTPISIGGIENKGTIVGYLDSLGSGAGLGIDVDEATIAGDIVNHASGSITGVDTAIRLNMSELKGDLRNSGRIKGEHVALRVNHSSVENIVNEASGTIKGGGIGLEVTEYTTIEALNNKGEISGAAAGIAIGGGSRVESITNSGTLSGGIFALLAAPDSLGKLNIAGNDTARFIGAVDVRGADVELLKDATYTLRGDEVFTLKNFLNSGTLVVAANTSDTGPLRTLAPAGAFNGDYTQAASGTLKFGVTNDQTFGHLHIGGTATLGSNAKIAVDVTDPNYRFTSQQLKNVFTANTLVSDGTFAVTDNSTLFDFGALKDGNAINLTITAAANGNTSGGVTDIVRNMGNSPATGAAAVLDRTFAANPSGALAGHFIGLTSDRQVSEAVTQTLPLLTGGSAGATSNTLSGINRVVQARQDSNSGLSSGDAATTEKNLWIKSFGSWADQSERSGVSGFDANTKGFAIGADTAVSDSTRLGVAFAYAKTQVDSDSRIAPQDADIDTFQLIGYGSYALAPDTELNFQVDAGQNRNEGKRRMPFADAVAKSDFDSYSAHAGVGLGHTLRFGQDLTFVPSVRADYTWIGEEAYHEKGAGALNLDVGSRNAEELLLSVDGKLNYKITASTVLSANAGVGYNVLNEQASLTSTYAGSPGAAFSTRGLDPEPWVGRVGLGLSHTLDSGTEVSLRYDAESRSDFLNQGASVKARWAF